MVRPPEQRLLTEANADTVVTTAATTPGASLNTALNATFVPKWKATTAYLAGDKVLSPAGDVVSAKVNFTSGASFNAANWNYSATYFTQASTATDALLKSSLTAKLGTFWTALGNRNTAPAEVLFLGDSLTEGLGATQRQFRTVDRVRDALRARYPSGVKGGVGFIPAWYATSTFPDPWTKSGSVTHNGTGLGLRSDGVGVAGTKTITVTGTSVDIIYAKNTSASSFSYSVDGGAATTVSVSAAGAFTDGFRVRVTLGASGSHTLTITGVTGTSYIAGIYVYDGDETKGIHVWEAGHSGYKVSDFTNSWGTSGGAVTSLNPHLVVIELGTNELAGNIDPATYKANMLTLIGNIRAGVTTNPSFLLIGSQEHQQAFTYPWSQYLTKLQEIADADTSVAFLDLTQYLPKVTVPDASGGLYLDTIHLTDAGHARKSVKEMGILGEVSAAPTLTTAPTPASAASVGLIGDSITNNNGSVNGLLFSNGYWPWADMLLGHRLDLQHIDGVPGSGCLNPEWSGRVDVLVAKKLAWNVVEIGTNDISSGGTFADITTALTTTLDKIAAAGSQALILTVPPRNALTSGQQTVHGQVNAWIRQLPAVRRGVQVADAALYLTDPANTAPAQYVAAYSSDGIHPTPEGSKQMGRAIFKALDRAVPLLDGLAGPASDKGNWLSQAAAAWTGGASAAPTSWTVQTSGTAPTYSQVARADGLPGVLQRITVPAGSTVRLNRSIGGYAAGDRFIAYLEIAAVSGVDAAPAANTQAAYIYMQAFTAAYGIATATGSLYPNGTQPNVAPIAGLLQTQTLVVPSNGLQEIDIFIQLSGGGTYDLGRVGIIKVGAGY